MNKNKRKGILLAGGTGSRLFPLTKITSKQLLPVYDKPLIYYPLSTLMLAGVKDILIITSPDQIDNYRMLLGDGENFGVNLSYEIQEEPLGIAHSLIIAEKFLDSSACLLILGDNIFHGNNLKNTLNKISSNNNSTIFAYHVSDPHRYGIVNFNDNNEIISIEEKPSNPKSNYAVTGIYFYDKNAPYYARELKPSERNELEITDLNLIYLKKNKLKIEILDQGISWIDTGTHDSLLDASIFVSTIERRQGLKIGCPEEIAFNNGWITRKKLTFLANKYNNSYSNYLKKILNGL